MNTAWTVAAVILFAGFANAQNMQNALNNRESRSARYLVTFKSKQGFSRMNSHWSQAEGLVPVQKSLRQLNAVVLKSPTAESLASLGNHPEVAAIEAEYFLPSPKPVHGFKPKVQTTMRLRPQFAILDSADTAAGTADAATPIFNEGLKTPWGIMAVNAGAAWAGSQAGAQARVLVLDTGIDPEHQDLKSNFEQGKNFFENEEGDVDAADYVDKVGHGTHVAGTIAAAYNEKTGFTGVAPKAKLLMGRVCGEVGCSSIAISEGINWGIEQKVDVINMSLGGAFSSPNQEMAVRNAEEAGVMIVAASGNGGIGTVSFPAAYPSVYAVGAIDLSLKKTAFSQWGKELDIVAPGSAVVSSVPRGSGRDSVVKISFGSEQREVKSAAFSGTKLVPVAVVKNLESAGLGKPEEFAAKDFKGKFALISRGEIRFSEKVANAMASGAAGAVIFNNVPGLMQGALTEDGSELDFPVVMIQQTDGAALLEALAKGAVATAAITTMPSDYAMFDGTSMASPHVAGVAALVRSANKKLTPAQVRAVLSGTAMVLGPNLENEYGAGNIQADKAVAAANAQ